MSGVSKGPYPDPREDLESRSPNLGLGFRVLGLGFRVEKVDPLIRGPILTTKGTLEEPITGSTFWILPAGLGTRLNDINNSEPCRL